MKILVLGGTGAMGRHLVKLLAEDGNQVTVSTRQNLQGHESVKYMQGNAKNMDFLQQLLSEQWDAIVDFMVYNTEELKQRINLLLSKTDQYVFLSSARVYAASEQPLTENSERLLDTSQDEKYLATDEYALTKARQENLLTNSGTENWTIIRPYITYSEDRLQLCVIEKEGWLYRALKGRTIVFSKDIQEKLTTLTYGLDVAMGIKAIIGNQEALSKCFHITADKAITWKEVLNIYLSVLEKDLGHRPKVLLADLNSFQNCQPAKYQIVYDRLFDRTFYNANIGSHVDLNNFSNASVGLKSCIECFLQSPSFRKINWKTEAIKDRLTKEHTPISEIPGAKQKVKYLLFRYLLRPNLK